MLDKIKKAFKKIVKCVKRIFRGVETMASEISKAKAEVEIKKIEAVENTLNTIAKSIKYILENRNSRVVIGIMLLGTGTAWIVSGYIPLPDDK